MIHLDGALRRAEITQRTGLNKSTVLSLVDELTTLGLVHEASGSSDGSRGRPSPIVHPNTESVAVFAAEIAVDFARISLVGLGGHVLQSVDVDINPHDAGPRATAQALGEAGYQLLTPGITVVAAATAVHGVVAADGHLITAPNLGWHDIDLRASSERFIDTLPVFFGNDADLGALGEHRRGVARDARDVLFLSAERGIGGGMLRDGNVQKGIHGYSTEVGHLVVRRDGRQCACGSHGCLETEIGEPALLRKAHRRSDARTVIELARSGDTAARDAVLDVAGWLGFALGNLTNLFDPEIIVAGGYLADVVDFAPDVVATEMAKASLVDPEHRPPVVGSALGADAVLVGAAELAFDHILQDPAAIAPRPTSSASTPEPLQESA